MLERLRLDVLCLDTHAALSEATLLCLALIVNQVSADYNPAEIKSRVEQIDHSEAAAVLPYVGDMQVLASAGIFALRYPDHPLTAQIKQAAAQLME